MTGQGITVDILTQLRVLAEQAIGTVNGSANTLGPLRQCKAVLTATVVTGTLDAKLQQSSDNVTFYDVPGGSFLDPSDGAIINAVGQYSILVDLTMRYVRTVGVVAADVVTWGVDLGVIK